MEFCCSLIREKSISGKEGDVAKLIKNRMEGVYDEVWIDEFGDVIARLGSGKRSLVLEGHMDTVKADENWEHDPFGGEVADGKIYGRGTSDMKGALAAMVYGAALSPRVDGTIYVVATVMEEIFEGVAFGKVLDEIRADYVVIGEATNLNINIRTRGRAEIAVKTKGRSAHSSNPQLGINAVYSMASLIEGIRSKHELGSTVIELTDIVSLPYPGESVVPYLCRATFDRRLTIGEDEDAVLGPIEKIIKKVGIEAEAEIAIEERETYTGKMLRVKKFFPAWLIDRKHELAEKSLSAMRGMGIPAKFSSYSFCTDGSESAGIRGIPTIGFGPSREELAHVKDEYIGIDQLVKAAEGYAALARSLLP